MEGLEISEVMLSEVLEYTTSARFDSEFFKKSHLRDDKKILSKHSKKLSEVTEKIDVGFVGSMTSHYREDGVVLLQTKNVGSFFVLSDDTVKITPSFHAELKKSQIAFEDILIARSGSFGKAAIYLEEPSINSSDIIIIRANREEINPYFLTAFLNSALGINQMIRFASGGLQGHVNLTILEELRVPVLGGEFQETIGITLQSAFESLQKSKQLYAKAEALLLKSLGLENFSPSNKNTNIKSFKDSFATTGRLDAEYYQPKYEEIIAHIKAQPNLMPNCPSW